MHRKITSILYVVYLLLAAITIVLVIDVGKKRIKFNQRLQQAPTYTGTGIVESVKHIPGRGPGLKEMERFELNILVSSGGKEAAYTTYNVDEGRRYQNGDSLIFDYKKMKPFFFLREKIYIWKVRGLYRKGRRPA